MTDNATLTPSSQEHDQQMVETFEKGQKPVTPPGDQQQTQPAADRPSWLPEKFDSPEKFAASYAELEAKLGAQSEQPTTPTPEQAAEAAKSAGFDMAALQSEYTTNGSLSADTYTKLEAAGFDKAAVDGYIAGQEALAANFRSSVLDSAGGEEAYGAMVQWASTNMSDSEIDAYDRAVSSGDIDGAKMAVAALKARFTEANGSEPNLLNGGNSDGADGDVFRSVPELTAAMRDPRYASDPAYRADVEAKVRRSKAI